MNFNVSLDNKQIDEIASVTADKVLATVKYHRDNEAWYEREIKELKHKVSQRDSLLVEKDLYIEGLRRQLRELRKQIRENSLNKEG